MQFKTYAKLIDRAQVMIMLKGNESFIQIKEVFAESCLRNLIDRASEKLANANLEKEHLVTFELIVHAQEINDDLEESATYG